MIQTKKGEVMDAKKSKAAPTRPIRWHDADWIFVGEVAKSIGLSRSAFVKRSALLAAEATKAGLTPYSVGGARATPQNTRPNKITKPIAKQVGSEVCGGGEPNHAKPEGDSGTNFGEIGAARGKNPTNGAGSKASKAKIPRS